MPVHAPGWYPDYQDRSQLRYWDGDEWTQYVHAPDGPDKRWRFRKMKRTTFKPSAQLAEATYRMVFADRWMIVFLFLGGVVSALASAAILIPAATIGHTLPAWQGDGLRGVLVAAAAFGASTFIMQFVMGAVIGAAMQRAEGQPVTVREACRIAWGRRRQLLAWALVSTFVGAGVRMLERTGMGGLVAALTLNLGWAVATVFATPVIMVEGTMPLETLKRSAGVLRRHFGVTVIGNVTLALPWAVLSFSSIGVAVVGGIVLISTSGVSAVIGALVLVAGLIGVCFCYAISSALSAYLQANIYRYAAGLQTPGVDQRWFPPQLPA